MTAMEGFRIKKLSGNLFLCASPSQQLRFLSPGEHAFLSGGKLQPIPTQHRGLIAWLKANKTTDKQPKFRLETLYLEITDLCNLRCSYCINASARRKTRGNLSDRTFSSVVSDFAKLGGKTVILSGGEPLLHPDIVEFAGLVKSKGLRTIIKTNGIIFNAKTELLCSMGVSFDISLDSAKAKTHDRYRGAGSFKLTLKSLQAIKSAGGSLNLCSTVLNTDNIGREKTMIALAASLGFRTISFTLAMRSGRDCSRTATTSQELLGRTLTRLFRLKLQFRDRINVEGCLFGEALGILTYGGQRMCYGCSIGRVVKISSDGSVFSCPYFTNTQNSIGNINKNPLRRLAGKSGPLKLQVTALFSKRNRIPKCTACFWKDFCGGGCAVESVASCGTLLVPDGSCKSRDLLFRAILRSLYTGGLKL